MQLLYQETGLSGRKKDMRLCLESLAQVSALVDRICNIIVQLPYHSQDEYEPVHLCLDTHPATVNVSNRYTRRVPTTHLQLKSDIETACCRLETLKSQLCCADEVARQEEAEMKMHLSIRTASTDVGSQSRTNTFKRLSAGSDSQQVLVSTTGDPILAQDVISAPQARQIFGQMSDVSLKAFMEE
jgi:hypothetical protein